MEFWPENF